MARGAQGVRYRQVDDVGGRPPARPEWGPAEPQRARKGPGGTRFTLLAMGSAKGGRLARLDSTAYLRGEGVSVVCEAAHSEPHTDYSWTPAKRLWNSQYGGPNTCTLLPRRSSAAQHHHTDHSWTPAKRLWNSQYDNTVPARLLTYRVIILLAVGSDGKKYASLSMANTNEETFRLFLA